MNNNQTLLLWILFLSCIVVAAAIIVNFNMGDAQFKIALDMANR